MDSQLRVGVQAGKPSSAIGMSHGKQAKWHKQRSELFSSWKSYSPFVSQMKGLHNIEILVIRLD